MSWRLANSLIQLRKELNAIAPNRKKASDGTIGDAAHRARASDHNPNAQGVVCAFDMTHDPANGADMGKITNHLLKYRHPALKYVIYNRRIASARSNWNWRTYNGSNPHTLHAHVSVGVGPDGRSTGAYDNTTSWKLASLAGAHDPGSTGSKYESYKKGQKAGSRTVGQFTKQKWSAGDDVKELQRILNAWYPKLPKLARDGYFGPKTTHRVRQLQRNARIKIDGFVGPQTWRVLRVIK